MIVLTRVAVNNDWVIYRDGYRCWQFIPLDISFKICDGHPVCYAKHYVLMISLLNFGIEFTWEEVDGDEEELHEDQTPSDDPHPVGVH